MSSAAEGAQPDEAPQKVTTPKEPRCAARLLVVQQTVARLSSLPMER